MKQKLLLLTLLAFISFNGYSQAVAYPVQNMYQCFNEVFNLTTIIPQALGNQNPQTHTVTFFTSLSAAQANAGQIANTSAYVAPQSQVIYYRVTKTTDATFAVGSFTIGWGSVIADDPADVTVCGSYILPALTNGNYYSGPNGTGVIIPAGSIITASQTIYVYAQGPFTGGMLCSAENSFTITVNMNSGLQQPTPLESCSGSIPGFATFDLTSKIPEITPLLIEQIEVFFYELATDAAGGVNLIPNPTSYTNITPNQQVIFATVMFNGQPLLSCNGSDISIVQLQLIAAQCTNNTISGHIAFDSDSNGCTDADVDGAGISVYCIQGNNSFQTFTNADGNYTFNNVPDGASVVTVVQNAMQMSLTPAAHQVTMPGDGTNKNFCITTPNPVNDVAVYLMPISQARPGFAATYSLVYQNLGNQPASGVISVYFPGTLMTYVSSVPAMTVTGSAMSLNYTLAPFQSKTVYVTLMVMVPPTVVAGTVLTTVAIINAGVDTVQDNNTFVLQQIAVNSYDPNDIAVREGEFITEVQADGYLHYTIRFQNIGNADAVNVRIENSLNANLDWATLQPLSASHSYNMVRLVDDVTFTFNNINLPGSQVNEPDSHGYVTYRIKPKASIQLGDVITAEAGIYFDFNPVVETNTITTTVQNAMAADDFAAHSFTIYPNPASGVINLQLKNAASADVRISDVMGKTVLISKISETESSLNIAALNNGMYFITLTAEGRSATKKLVVK